MSKVASGPMADTPAVLPQDATLVDPATLELHPANPRQGDVGAIVESIQANGFFDPLVVQVSTRRVLDGNHRLLAARSLGMPLVPVAWVDVDDDRALRILLAANRVNDLASYDDRALAALLTDMAQQTPLGLVGTGFDGDALDQLLADLAYTAGRPEIVEPTPSGPPANPLTRPGDLWELGAHRLVCGDCRDPDVVARLMDGEQINVAFTSPPYAEQRKYDESSGFRPIPPDEYVEWFRPVAENVAAHLAADGSWFVNIKPSADGLDTELYVLDMVIAHAREWGWHFATEFCWERVGVPKSVTQRFKNQFEPVYQFTRARWKMRPESVQHATDSAITPFGAGAGDTGWSGEKGNGGRIGGQGRKRRNDAWVDPIANQGTNWQPGEYVGPGLAYPGNRLPTFSGTHEALGHAAAFPVGLPAWFARAFTDEGDALLDPFAGSGSTLIAAEQEKRRGYGIELSPAYCDVTLRRFQSLTGIKPTRDGEPYDFLAEP